MLKDLQMKRSGLSIIFGLLLFCGACIAPSCAATEYVLSASTQDLYGNGINHTASDEAVIVIEDDFTITAINCSGIASAGPLTIRGEPGKVLHLIVYGSGASTYGITAPSVEISEGNLDILADGLSTAITCGIYSSEGDISISGGTVKAIAESKTSHKNKGIFSAGSVIITGGDVTASGSSGDNSFGMDGDGADGKGGVSISGGTVDVYAEGGSIRNFGIDSRYGSVIFTGDAAITIYEDESGDTENYAFKSNITSITGGKAVVFTGENSDYELQKDALLAQDFALIPGKTFVIPEGLTLAIEKGVEFEVDDAEFVYETKYLNKQGQTVYTSAPVDPDSVASPVSLWAVLTGIAAACVIIRRK